MLQEMVQVDATKRPSVDFILQKAKWFKNDKHFDSRTKSLYKALEVDVDLVEQMNSVNLSGLKFKKPRIQ